MPALQAVMHIPYNVDPGVNNLLQRGWQAFAPFSTGFAAKHAAVHKGPLTSPSLPGINPHSLVQHALSPKT